MTKSARIAGAALILFALLYFGSFVFASPFVGQEDGDNPASSLEFIRLHGNYFFLSGLCAAAAALALTVAGLAIADSVLQPASSLLHWTTTALGLFAAAFYLVFGVLRMNSPGTLLYIHGLNRDWGLAAYSAVQMAGTQGLASAGVFALSLWAIGLSVAGWRSRKLGRDLALLGFLPALPWVLGLVGRLGVLPDSLWLVYIGSILFGIPLWCVVVGVALLRLKPSA